MERRTREFFEENYFTTGMLILVDRAFRHLSGNGSVAVADMENVCLGLHGKTLPCPDLT